MFAVDLMTILHTAIVAADALPLVVVLLESPFVRQLSAADHALLAHLLFLCDPFPLVVKGSQNCVLLDVRIVRCDGATLERRRR